MKFDAILHALLPKDDSFFTLFEKDSGNLLIAAGTFRDLMSNSISKEERAQKIKKIEEIEHRGDDRRIMDSGFNDHGRIHRQEDV